MFNMNNETVRAMTLNLYGDAKNPFEFVNKEKNFYDLLIKFQDYFKNLKWGEFKNIIGDLDKVEENLDNAVNNLKNYCVGSDNVFDYFTEVILKNDNKFQDFRFNLIVFALNPYDKNTMNYNHAKNWKTIMKAFAKSNTYNKDPNLWLWDLVCNVIINSNIDEYIKICEETYLNSKNYRNNINTFIEYIVDTTTEDYLIIGIQEWPDKGSEKEKCYIEELEKSDLKVFKPDNIASVAIIYSKNLGDPLQIEMNFAKEDMKTIIDDSDFGKLTGNTKDDDKNKKTIQSLINSTTASKLTGCRFTKAPDDLVTFVMHCKEPKTNVEIDILTEFIKKITNNYTKWLLLTDTNLNSIKDSEYFTKNLNDSGILAMPSGPDSNTTSKERSILHGQCYDKKKCLKQVMAPKDKIIMSETLESTNEVDIYPKLSDNKLLSRKWPSDHCGVSTTIKLKNVFVIDYYNLIIIVLLSSIIIGLILNTPDLII